MSDSVLWVVVVVGAAARVRLKVCLSALVVGAGFRFPEPDFAGGGKAPLLGGSGVGR